MDKVIISLSGGLGSFVSACLANELDYEYEMVFADTKMEDPDLYRFLHDIQRRLNKPIHWLEDGRDPWEVFEDVKFIGNSRIAPCSRILKTEVVKKYISEHFPDYDLVLGIGLEEVERLERAKKVWEPRKVRSLLVEQGLSHHDMVSYYVKYGIKEPELYSYGFPHNNCGGACVRAGQKAWLTLLEKLPERFYEAERREQEVMKKVPNAKPFLKIRRNKKTQYVSLKEWRELYEAGEIKVSPYDYGGCGCFIDE